MKKIYEDVKVDFIKSNNLKYTFSMPKVGFWIKENTVKQGKVLNLFAGKTRLFDDEKNIKEYRVDLSKDFNPQFNIDAFQFVKNAKKIGLKFDTIILDPPYSLRKSMEKYDGKIVSNFRKIKDILPDIINVGGNIITCGYHSVSMGKKRGFIVNNILLVSHGGAHHDTIITNEIFLRK